MFTTSDSADCFVKGDKMNSKYEEARKGISLNLERQQNQKTYKKKNYEAITG
jgi:hypothetical protein